MKKLAELNTEVNTKQIITPDWAKGIIWYQIFPERFRNGDKNNDPRLGDIIGSWPHDDNTEIETHPWNSDWYKLQPYELNNGKDIWFNLQRRRYGGDLKGIIEKLDYLKDFGVGAIYLNPIFESPSHHKYDGATYHHVDPTFGPDPSGDRKLIKGEIPHDPSTWKWTSADRLFVDLISEVHKRGMKIIIDGVFNHMGINSWAFKDVQKNQQRSRYKNWFNVLSWEDKDKGNKFEYSGWWGVKELPELKQDINGIVEEPKKYIFDITRRWMDPDADGDPQDGIDGWRLDVAFMIEHNFWKEWRKLVKSINEQSYLTAEIIDTIEVLKPYLEGDEFDAVMNYNFAFACAEFFIDDTKGATVTKFDSNLRELRDSFPPEINHVMQNLFGSHDTNRLLSHIANKDLASYRDWASYYEISKGSNPDYIKVKPKDIDRRIQKLMAIFQFTYLGAPMVYYGDEAGMWGANDPDCRKPMIWYDMEYEDELYKPDQTKYDKPNAVSFNQEMFEHYKMLAKIRNNHPALRLGDFIDLLADDEDRILIFSRVYKSEKIIVAINNDKENHSPVINTESALSFNDLLDGSEINPTDGKLKIEIPAKWGRILLQSQKKR